MHINTKQRVTSKAQTCGMRGKQEINVKYWLETSRNHLGQPEVKREKKGLTAKGILWKQAVKA
jgi:hypothetical protein